MGKMEELKPQALEAAKSWFDAEFNGQPDTHALVSGVLQAYLAALPSGDEQGAEVVGLSADEQRIMHQSLRASAKIVASPTKAGEVSEAIGRDEYKRIISLMDDLRARAPFGYHEGPHPHFRPLTLNNQDVERLLDALLDAATLVERAGRRAALSLPDEGPSPEEDA